MTLKHPSNFSIKAASDGLQDETGPGLVRIIDTETKVSRPRLLNAEFVTHGDQRVLIDGLKALELAMPVPEIGNEETGGLN